METIINVVEGALVLYGLWVGYETIRAWVVDYNKPPVDMSGDAPMQNPYRRDENNL